MLFEHDDAPRRLSIADMTAGNNRPIRMPMIAITTSNSTSVNPACVDSANRVDMA